jgi:mono/diheme cytochrome c family protein
VIRFAPGVALAAAALAVALALSLTTCAGEPSGDGAGGATAITAAGGAGPGRPLTGEERAGEAIYRRENCARCHTLFDAPPPEGPVSLPVPPTPSALDARVGPDLGVEGHRRSDDWHHAHHYAPDVVVPGSRMTAYRHLFRPGPDGRPEPTADARRLVAWLQTLGRERRDVWAEVRLRDPAIPAPDGRPDGERLALGARLYARHCVACHGVRGDGRGPAAALLARPPQDFTAAAQRFRSTPPGEAPRDADLFRSITLGTGTGSAMPGFGHLEAEDRWALVRRIREFAPGLGGRGVELDARDDAPAAAGPAAGDAPAPAPGDDLVAAGAALFAELGCAACHGPRAEGRTAPGDGTSWRDETGRPIPATGDLRHPCGLRAGASEAALARALHDGVGPVMPSFALALEGRPWAPRAVRAWLLSLDPDRGAAGTSAPGP